MTLRLGFILCRWPVVQLAPPPGPTDPLGWSPILWRWLWGGPASLAEEVIVLASQARLLCVLQLYARRLFLIPFLFPQTRNQYFESKGRVREEKPQGTEACNCQSGSDLQTEPSRLIQHKVAAEEILPSQ